MVTSISGSPSSQKPTEVPHPRQKVRRRPAERYSPGVPWVKANPLSGKEAHETKAAPEERRQSAQWQWQRCVAGPVAR